jgi:hypothetical protein
VHFAHQRGILHRDLKPGNIVMDANGEPHVTDFGLAKRMDVDSGLTPSGTFIGTPSYMAPEQVVGKTGQLTTVADIYSLGAVLYFLLTGRPPFVGATPLETLRLVVEKEPVRPSTINRRLDRDLETICLKCLEKAPQGRYASADAVAEDLDRWLRQEPIQARPSGAWEHIFKWAKRKPAIASLIGAVFAVTAIGFAGVFWQWRRAQASAGAARVEAADNQQVTKFLQEMLEGVQPSVALGRDTTLLREVLKKAETRVDEELQYGGDVPPIAGDRREAAWPREPACRWFNGLSREGLGGAGKAGGGGADVPTGTGYAEEAARFRTPGRCGWTPQPGGDA